MEATKTAALRVVARNEPSPRRDGDAANERTIPALFLAASRARGAQTAMRWKRRGIWEAVPFAEYAAAVREIGCALMAFGLQRGECVAILSENQPEWVFADIGAQSVGCVVAAIDVSEPGERVVDILNACGARVLFVDSVEQLDAVGAILSNTPALECVVHFDARAGAVETRVQLVDLSRFRGDGVEFDKQHRGRWEAEIGRARADDVAIMAGSPGLPGETLSHRNLVRQLDAMAQCGPGSAGDEQLSLLPLSQVQERCFSAYRPLAVGSIVNFAEGPDNLVDGLREVAPHLVMAPTAIWQMLHDTTAAAIAEASPLGRLAFRLALDARSAGDDPAASGHAVPVMRRLGAVVARLLVLNRIKTMIGLRRARALLCSGSPMPAELSRWYHSLGLNVVVDAPNAEGWRAPGANDTLAHKESR